MPNWIEVLFSVAVMLSPFVAGFYIFRFVREKKFVENCNSTRIGMSQSKVIANFGNNYTRSTVGNNIEILQWQCPYAFSNRKRKIMITFESNSVTKIISKDD